jgi:hypothetical protein
LPLSGVNGRAPHPSPPPGVQGEKAHQGATDGGLAIRTKLLIVPLGLAVSGIAHLALLMPALYFGGAKPFDSAPADAITVDIVSPEEAGDLPKPDVAPVDAALPFDANAPAAPSPPPPSAAPALSVEARPQPQEQSPAPERAIRQSGMREAAAQPQVPEPTRPLPAWLSQQVGPAEPEPQQQESDITNMFAMPLMLPGGQVGGRYDSQAVDRADVSSVAAAAFRRHLKTCSTLPAGVAPEVRVVLRVYLKPDGSLAAGPAQNPEPIKVEGVSRGGGSLFQSAVAALRKCQPYKMLPPDKYEEWKQLDITFTRDNF